MNSNARQLATKTMIALLLACAASTNAAIRYVALDGSGADGQSWATAYKNLQKAIDEDAVTDGDEIRVKQGRYAIDRAIKVTKGVKILGGYRGAGEERDARVFTTTFDGGGIAWHGFVVTTDAVIDGLTITGGNASYDTELDGGGMLITDCSATVANCTFARNACYRWGGGIALLGADGTVITDCTFQENITDSHGGGIYCQEADVTIHGCVFIRNEAGEGVQGWGGGIMNERGAPAIVGCTFTENLAHYGAGVCNWLAKAIVESCTFADCNELTACGGGIYNAGGSPTIRKCLFQGNGVTNWGGAILDEYSSGTVIDCIMWGNSAMVHGGAVYIGGNPNLPAAYPQLINCTMYGNKATRGGALYSYGCAAKMWNCILWGNQAYVAGGGIFNNTLVFTATTAASYCDIQGDDVYPGTGNLCVDPLFEDPMLGNFQLQPGSPCIDAGSHAASIETLDYEGHQRVVDGEENGSAVVDLGALEYRGYTEVSRPYRGEILETVVYDGPADVSATYVFSLLVETDGAVSRIEFRTPNSGSTYEIPSDSQTSAGGVSTSHQVRDGKHVWRYQAELDSPAASAAYGDGTYQISFYCDGTSEYEIQVPFLMPRSGAAIARPVQKPAILSPASGGGMGSPVTTTWDVCTDAIANTISLTITDSATGDEVATDAFDTGAIASDTYALPEGPYGVTCAFANLQETTDADGTPFTCGKAIAVTQSFEVLYSAVYRFWSVDLGQHFYTISESEKNELIADDSHLWFFEGMVYHACSTPCHDGLLPVYCFRSDQARLYSIDPQEGDRLIAEGKGVVWANEGIAFYAYPEGAQSLGCVPVYRFWNASNNAYFYTANEVERATVITEYGHIFADQGIAFYAYP